MPIGKKQIIFEIFCLKKYSQSGKGFQETDSNLPADKIVFLSRFNCFFAAFSRRLSRDVFMEEIEKIDWILDATICYFF